MLLLLLIIIIFWLFIIISIISIMIVIFIIFIICSIISIIIIIIIVFIILMYAYNNIYIYVCIYSYTHIERIVKKQLIRCLTLFNHTCIHMGVPSYFHLVFEPGNGESRFSKGESSTNGLSTAMFMFDDKELLAVGIGGVDKQPGTMVNWALSITLALASKKANGNSWIDLSRPIPIPFWAEVKKCSIVFRDMLSGTGIWHIPWRCASQSVNVSSFNNYIIPYYTPVMEYRKLWP